MENKWQVVVVTILAVLVIAVGCIVGFRKNEIPKVENLSAVMEVIQYDEEDTAKVVRSTNIEVNDTVELEEDEGNNIKILRITDTGVEIERVVTKYEVIDEKEKESESYEETVRTKVNYNEEIPANINEEDPFGSTSSKGKYTYNIQFVQKMEEV